MSGRKLVAIIAASGAARGLRELTKGHLDGGAVMPARTRNPRRRAFIARAASRLIGALAALILIGTAASAEVVSCDSVNLSFDTQGLASYCESGHASGRIGSEHATGWRARYEAVTVYTSGTSITVVLDEAGRYTYIEPGTARDNVDFNPWFTNSRNWTNEHRVAGYQVQEFEGIWEGSYGYWSCVGFVRYGKPVRGAPGYGQRLYGIYCVNSGDSVPDHEIERFLRSIEY